MCKKKSESWFLTNFLILTAYRVFIASLIPLAIQYVRSALCNWSQVHIGSCLFEKKWSLFGPYFQRLVPISKMLTTNCFSCLISILICFLSAGVKKFIQRSLKSSPKVTSKNFEISKLHLKAVSLTGVEPCVWSF